MTKNTSKLPQITVYLPQVLKDALVDEAKRTRRSMNGQAVWCLAQCLGVELEETESEEKEEEEQP